MVRITHQPSILGCLGCVRRPWWQPQCHLSYNRAVREKSLCVGGGSTRVAIGKAAKMDRDQFVKGLSSARQRGSDLTLKAMATFRARQWPHQICIFKRQLCWQFRGRDYRTARPEVEREISVKIQKYSPKRRKYFFCLTVLWIRILKMNMS